MSTVSFSNTPFTLQAVSPLVTRVWGNVPVVGLPSVCDLAVANHLLPCTSYRSCKSFQASASNFGTVDMCRRFCASAYEFLTMIIEDVVQDVHKVMIWSSFGVIQRDEVS